ncbi:hypothetical protein [Streptomyces meridianus]|uniref:Integral membrane protein n=1 Tax=Streptomyces meridianus TaxID=2938945 RepID=A0ABT0X2U7_9ACTN|nr:hypothetical protein [Streptomyces meridianus]MCM2576865.1 hypothetical protein [Streptomyces meridianus]
MGIESEQLVYDYLSRVGDLAQQRKLPSADRMRLVAGLRDEIERRRAEAVADSPAAVRRILGGIGTPEEVVATAGGTGVQPAGPGLPGAASPTPASREERLPAPRSGTPEPRVPVVGASPPHLAGSDELAAPADFPGARTGGEPDWWRVGAPGFTPGGMPPGTGSGSSGAFGAGTTVPGFTGGIEIPEILKPPPPPPGPGDAPAGAGPDGTEQPRRNLLRRLIGRRRPAQPEAGPAAAPAAPRRALAPMALAAAALLLVGAVLGSLIALALGWLLAYGGTRRLSRTEAKAAALGVPGLVAGGGLVWLWGRRTGRWGEPLPVGQLADALADTWPVVVRVAAVASALFLVWRAARRPRG